MDRKNPKYNQNYFAQILTRHSVRHQNSGRDRCEVMIALGPVMREGPEEVGSMAMTVAELRELIPLRPEDAHLLSKYLPDAYHGEQDHSIPHVSQHLSTVATTTFAGRSIQLLLLIFSKT